MSLQAALASACFSLAASSISQQHLQAQAQSRVYKLWPANLPLFRDPIPSCAHSQPSDTQQPRSHYRHVCHCTVLLRNVKHSCCTVAFPLIMEALCCTVASYDCAGRLPVLQSVCQSKWVGLYKLWRLVHECHAKQPDTAIPWGHIASSLLNCPLWRQDAASDVLVLYR